MKNTDIIKIIKKEENQKYENTIEIQKYRNTIEKLFFEKYEKKINSILKYIPEK